MALRALFVFLSFLGALGEDVDTALASDDVCEAGQDCSLELRQLRGIKVHYLEALEDDEEESAKVEEEAELEGGGCTGAADMGVWKGGGKKSFDAALNHCGRSCAAGFPCTKDCMQKKGYSDGCASCMAQLVGCSRDHCMNQCITNDKAPACTHCVKANCRPKMKACSGLNAEDVDTALASDDVCEAGQDCSLELRQLRGIKVHYLEALEDDEEESAKVEEEAELEGGGCTGAADMGVWKGGGKKSFDAALNHCGRSCAAGFPCTKDCMQKKGYSDGCASCMAQLVGCSRDHCMNQCITNDKAPACTHCVKANCRPKMKACSGLNAGGK
ncbi:unnamed protein product [Symbiodinium sp. CCMP2592]|nr:unnamed protein product [Symbiodinium sp. CCMP2592]